MAKIPPVTLDPAWALDVALDTLPDVWEENETREWLARVREMMTNPPAAIDQAIAYRLGTGGDSWAAQNLRELVTAAARDALDSLLRHERNPETAPYDGRAHYVALIIDGALRGDMTPWLAWASLNAARGSMRAVAAKEYGAFMAAQRQAHERSQAAKERRQDDRDRAWYERAAAVWANHGQRSMRHTATILATEDRVAESPIWKAYELAHKDLKARAAVEAGYAEVIRKALAKIEKQAPVPT